MSCPRSGGIETWRPVEFWRRRLRSTNAPIAIGERHPVALLGMPREKMPDVSEPPAPPLSSAQSEQEMRPLE